MPAWLHEKSPSLPPSKIIWHSNLAVVLLYTLLGVTGSMSIASVPNNFLAFLAAGHQGVTTQMCANVFSFFIIGFGIPLFCIIMRYNLVNAGVATHEGGLFLTAVLPWFTSFLLYQGKNLLEIFTWGGLVLNGLISFILPLVVAVYALYPRVERDEENVFEGRPVFEVGRPKSASLFHFDDDDEEEGDEEGNSDSEDEGGGERVRIFPRFLSIDTPEKTQRALKALLAVTTVAVGGAIANKSLDI